MGPLLIALVTLLVIGLLVSGPFITERRRRKIRARPFPPAWRAILERRVPYVHRLPADLRRQLEQHIQVFIAEKPFIGCDGQEIDDEVRVTIAAQACLLILNRKPDYFPKLSQVLVYPGAFIVERVRAEPSGILQEERNALSGESWSNGQVVLSWDDTLQGAAVDNDGRNVVIHEFAHQLDQQKGHANGAPYLGNRDRYPRWSQVLSYEFAMLQQRSMSGEPPVLLSYYGATNPAEFFAVASEVFFEQPAAMATLHPALYDELRQLYRVDPVAW
ncbi:Protein MtfA [Usitatibacter rugosus]|uniref:Protein MtfA n=1 Tax=Usitatibacter rugosus TaxID=2732067 RepID=A0A6M4GX24_9PROT|nr:M90 family metallopeptidase [Usitatibacter rugosus]QJR11820.1 Protein MtfA [Usitatibacter rugosus]